jgi:glycerol-3-phosphate O-acyltransferase
MSFFDAPLLSLLRWLLRRLVRFQTVPEMGQAPGFNPALPVCYALQVRQISGLLVLDDATARLGLPMPLKPMQIGSLRESASYFYLTRRGQPSPLRRNPYDYSRRFKRMVEAAQKDPSLDLQIVPVSVFWGRAPKNQDSILKALFSDAWVAPGFFKQGLVILFNGRQTLVKFGKPISLRAQVDAAAQTSGTGDSQAQRRIARLLRAEYKRERELVVGPNLSHRQTLVNSVIGNDEVQHAIRRRATQRKMPIERAELKARKMVYEIASDYSYPVIRAFDLGLTRLWNRIYQGVDVHRFETIAQVGAGAQMVYVPCHRSHVDYLLLSYVMYRRGLMPPQVAAGDNLNIPLIGGILRRAGAFFLRRSFKGDVLYTAVFSEYMHVMTQRGFPMEYFVEGGRSRTGRLLSPKGGLLNMTVESFQRDSTKPVVFIPIYVGYEQLVEGDSFLAELAGGAKKKESIFGIFNTARELRNKQYGKVHVNIGEPISLHEVIEASRAAGENQRVLISQLGRRITEHINDALVLNPVNLLSTAILGTARQAMDENRLHFQIGLLLRLAKAVPYSSRQTVTDLNAEQCIAYASKQGLIERIAHPLGDIFHVRPKQAALLTYFRNNTLHAFALASLVAALISRNPDLPLSRIQLIARQSFAFLRKELTISWSEDSMLERLNGILQVFVDLKLVQRLTLGGLTQYSPVSANLAGSFALEALGSTLRHTLERYFIVARTLASLPTGAYSAQSLEDRCVLLAQRVQYLHEAVGPDFAERAAFKAIVGSLLESGLADARENKIHATDALEQVADNADLLLPPDVDQAIKQLAVLSAEELNRAKDLLT